MKKILIIVLLLTMGLARIFSQTDTIVVSEEANNVNEDKYDRVYKLFIEEREKEINHLWKVDLMGLSLLYPNIAFEQGIGKSWSSETGLGFGFANSFLSYSSVRTLNNFHNSFTPLGANIYQSFKYYYNLKRRKSLGKRVNGFSGNYFAIILSTDYLFNQSNYYDRTAWRIIGGLHYGLQRRIGNIGYFEAFAGLGLKSYLIDDKDEYQPVLDPYIGVKVGFAIDSYKNLKRMLKK